MTVVLCRVDDRLVHGQVVVGWGQGIGLQRIVLADDDVARAEWEQELYRMAMPGGMELVFATVASAGSRLRELATDTVRTALLVGSVEAVAQLFRREPAVAGRINLGGVHHRPGRIERLPYVYLSPDELKLLRELEAEGADITCQDVPTATPVRLASL